MSKIYFVRHAHPDFSVHDDLIRPLSEKGIADVKKVTNFLIDKQIDKIFSSPYKRTIDTIKDFAEKLDLKINMIDDFRERKVDDAWIEDFTSFSKKQWNNFEYKLSHGESLKEVQERNITALFKIIKENKGENIVIGTHGTALSTIIQYYNNNFRYEDFDRIKNFMPYILCIEFKDGKVMKIEEFII